MNQKQVSQWRTVGVMLALAVIAAVSFQAAVRIPGGLTEFSARAFDTLMWSLLGFAGFAAGKSTIEHLAAGTGLRGAVRTLMTDAKPGDPEVKP